MITIPIRLSKEIKPPVGNSFSLQSVGEVTISPGQIALIETGMSFSLPRGVDLTVQAVKPGLFVVDWRMEDCLEVVVVSIGIVNIVAGEVWGKAQIVRQKLEKVRFAEIGMNGGRIIKGDAQPVKIRD